jgi:hypothetical protein
MRCTPALLRVATAGLILAAAPPASAQETQAYPPISARQFVSGSIEVSVSVPFTAGS